MVDDQNGTLDGNQGGVAILTEEQEQGEEYRS
jgi:hypothetical protein